MNHLRSYILLLCSVALANMVFSETAPSRIESANDIGGRMQLLRLNDASGNFAFPLAANADLYNLPRDIQRVIVRIEDESSTSEALLETHDGVLVLVPQFSVLDGRNLPMDLPVWDSEQAWAGGEVSSQGRLGLSAFAVFDALLGYLGRVSHFPQLQEVVFVGHGMTVDLVVRHGLRPQVATSFRIRHIPGLLARR